MSYLNADYRMSNKTTNAFLASTRDVASWLFACAIVGGCDWQVNGDLYNPENVLSANYPYMFGPSDARKCHEAWIKSAMPVSGRAARLSDASTPATLKKAGSTSVVLQEKQAQNEALVVTSASIPNVQHCLDFDPDVGALPVFNALITSMNAQDMTRALNERAYLVVKSHILRQCVANDIVSSSYQVCYASCDLPIANGTLPLLLQYRLEGDDKKTIKLLVVAFMAMPISHLRFDYEYTLYINVEQSGCGVSRIEWPTYTQDGETPVRRALINSAISKAVRENQAADIEDYDGKSLYTLLPELTDPKITRVLQGNYTAALESARINKKITYEITGARIIITTPASMDQRRAFDAYVRTASELFSTFPYAGYKEIYYQSANGLWVTTQQLRSTSNIGELLDRAAQGFTLLTPFGGGVSFNEVRAISGGTLKTFFFDLAEIPFLFNSRGTFDSLNALLYSSGEDKGSNAINMAPLFQMQKHTRDCLMVFTYAWWSPDDKRFDPVGKWTWGQQLSGSSRFMRQDKWYNDDEDVHGVFLHYNLPLPMYNNMPEPECLAAVRSVSGLDITWADLNASERRYLCFILSLNLVTMRTYRQARRGYYRVDSYIELLTVDGSYADFCNFAQRKKPIVVASTKNSSVMLTARIAITRTKGWRELRPLHTDKVFSHISRASQGVPTMFAIDTTPPEGLDWARVAFIDTVLLDQQDIEYYQI